jgi:redox-sensitive bicupin YhaK (pirin superfamily)
MEIISLVLEGELEHRDSLGHGEVLRPGDVQVMSAGSGIRHSEFNPSKDTRSHFLQVWITPSRSQVTPTYAQKSFPLQDQANSWIRVAGPAFGTDDGALPINQDAHVSLCRLLAGQTVTYEAAPKRGIWIQVASGNLQINGAHCTAGDGFSSDDGGVLSCAGESAESLLVLFDLQ